MHRVLLNTSQHTPCVHAFPPRTLHVAPAPHHPSLFLIVYNSPPLHIYDSIFFLSVDCFLWKPSLIASRGPICLAYYHLLDRPPDQAYLPSPFTQSRPTLGRPLFRPFLLPSIPSLLPACLGFIGKPARQARVFF